MAGIMACRYPPRSREVLGHRLMDFWDQDLHKCVSIDSDICIFKTHFVATVQLELAQMRGACHISESVESPQSHHQSVSASTELVQDQTCLLTWNLQSKSLD